MMPFSKEQNRRIYITALVLSFLLIVGSIYLHLRQKTHLGRMSFHLDRDRVQPTSGVETTTSLSYYDYDTKFIKNDDEEDSATYPSVEENDNSKSSSSEEESAQDDSEENTINNSDSNNIEEDSESDMKNDIEIDCLECLCMTINECRPTTCGSGYPCGLYMLSKYYWLDAGKPKVVVEENGEQTDEAAYLSCVKNDECSARAVHQYFDRYKRDCNKDGRIDCKDLISLHLLGPSGCLTKNISRVHENRMDNCLQKNKFYYDDPSYNEEEEEEVEDEDTMYN